MDWSDFWMSLGQILAGVIIGAVALWMRKLRTYVKKQTVNTSISDNMMLKQLITEIRTYYDADRVELYQFHNGDHYVSGASIQKVSLSHFATARGVSVPVTATRLNMPIGYVVTITDDLLKKPFVFYSSEDLFDESYFRSLLRYGGAKSALLRGVFSQKHNLIGFIVISWFENVTLTKEQQQAVKDFAVGVGDEMLMGT